MKNKNKMTEEIEAHVLKKYEILQKLGTVRLYLYFESKVLTINIL